MLFFHLKKYAIINIEWKGNGNMDKEKDIEKTVPIDILTAEELKPSPETRSKKYT